MVEAGKSQKSSSSSSAAPQRGSAVMGRKLGRRSNHQRRRQQYSFFVRVVTRRNAAVTCIRHMRRVSTIDSNFVPAAVRRFTMHYENLRWLPAYLTSAFPRLPSRA